MKIGHLDTDARPLVVAEIGNNHEGSFELACRLVELAAECGADGVKFQTFRTEHYVSRSDAERFARLTRFELRPPQFAALAELARARGLLFLSTPFDLESARFLSTVADAIKIASGDNTFVPLLECVSRTTLPMIISTGLADSDAVAATVEVVRRIRGQVSPDLGLALLHCVSSYPVPPAQASLRSISHLRSRFPGLTIGYSDHTLGPDAAVLAVALGARIIEKHFTIDKGHSSFRDHHLSADPEDMRLIVGRVRQASEMLGREEKVVQPCEVALAPSSRRSIVAAADLEPGHRLVLGDLTWVRPAGGLPPGSESRVIGRTLRRRVRFGERIVVEDVE